MKIIRIFDSRSKALTRTSQEGRVGIMMSIALSSCPDEGLKPHIRRQGRVERLHHINVLVEQHVAASESP